MPVSVVASGSVTPTLATDTTLVTQAAPSAGAVYVLKLDLAALANGEAITVRLRTRARGTDALRDTYSCSWQHAQGSDPLKVSPVIPVEAGNACEVVLRQDGGTARAVPWALVRLDG